jgi:hypothetical protein
VNLGRDRGRGVAVMVGLRDLKGGGRFSGGQKQGAPRALAARVEHDPVTERGMCIAPPITVWHADMGAELPSSKSNLPRIHGT